MVACLVGFLFIPDNLEWAKIQMEWLEGWKVGGRFSFLDWCGSCMVCYGALPTSPFCLHAFALGCIPLCKQLGFRDFVGR